MSCGKISLFSGLTFDEVAVLRSLIISSFFAPEGTLIPAISHCSFSCATVGPPLPEELFFVPVDEEFDS